MLTAPALPAEATQRTTKGAAAFFRYFFTIYSHGYLALDSSQLVSISDKECAFCKSAIDHIEATKLANDTTKGGRVTVTTAIAAPGDATTGLMVNAVIDQEKGITYSPNGSVYSTAPASKGARADAVVLWRHDRWVMMEVQVLD